MKITKSQLKELIRHAIVEDIMDKEIKNPKTGNKIKVRTALQLPDEHPANKKAKDIRLDQANCMGCLSQCRFSNWATNDRSTTGKKADPRSYCIQKTLQEIIHGDDVDEQLMFSGHGAYRFADDPFYANGFTPTVRELVDRLLVGK